MLYLLPNLERSGEVRRRREKAYGARFLQLVERGSHACEFRIDDQWSELSLSLIS